MAFTAFIEEKCFLTDFYAFHLFLMVRILRVFEFNGKSLVRESIGKIALYYYNFKMLIINVLKFLINKKTQFLQ